MSITSALYTGVSGLLNNAESMTTIGNNISNVNTIGFKQGRTIFSDLLSQNLGGNAQIGKGMQLQAVQNIFTQGTTQSSENVTDLAIQGNSFFAVKAPSATSPVTSQSAAFLTRAGAFNVDAGLTLVNPSGYQVLDTTGSPIVFSNNGTSPSTDFAKIVKVEPNGLITYLATDGITQNYYNKNASGVSVAANADPAAAGATASSAATAALLAGATAATTAAATNNYTDSVAANFGTASGAAAALAVVGGITQADLTGFDPVVAAADADVATATALPSGTAAEVVARNRALAEANAFRTAVVAVRAAAIAAAGAPGATDATVRAAATTTAASNNSGGVAAAGNALAAANAIADAANAAADVGGATAASVATAAVGAAGSGIPVNPASAQFVQRLAVVSATDPTALKKVGDSLYQGNGSAGVPSTGFTLAGNQPNGTSEQILSNTLEGSNVDMANEFVKMITTQRAYSANSKTITTTDQMTQEVLQLIR